MLVPPLAAVLLAGLTAGCGAGADYGCGNTGGCGATHRLSPEERAVDRAVSFAQAELDHKRHDVMRLVCPHTAVKWSELGLPHRAQAQLKRSESVGKGWVITVAMIGFHDREVDRSVHVRTVNNKLCVAAVRLQ